MMIIANILKAGENLIITAPFLAGINNERQYADALILIDYLLLNEPDNPLLDLVYAKINAWDKSSPEFNALRDGTPTGISLIRVLMEQYGLTFSDLPEIGSKSMVSRVLSGQRKLTLEHTKKLSLRFGLSPILFID